MGNRPLFKHRKRQYKGMWTPKVSGHGGVAHATWKAEAELRRCWNRTKKAETETNTEYEGRGRCKLAIGWPRSKQTRNRAAQRAGAEMDPGYRQSGNWLVGGEPWLRDPAHPGANMIGLPLLIATKQ